MSLHGRLDPYLKLSERALAGRCWTDAHGHALVACGRIEAMIDPILSHWDISAMAIFVREAGGSFTDFSGNQQLGNEAISCAPGLKDIVLGAFRP